MEAKEEMAQPPGDGRHWHNLEGQSQVHGQEDGPGAEFSGQWSHRVSLTGAGRSSTSLVWLGENSLTSQGVLHAPPPSLSLRFHLLPRTSCDFSLLAPQLAECELQAVG